MKGGELEIAPHGTAMTQGFHSFKTPVRIDSFQPHGHARLVGMTAEIFHPDTGKLEMISSVSNWTNQWHTSHVYEDDYAPLLAKGDVLVLTGYYDNTAKNKGNPDPDQWVGGGSRTSDEMSHAWITVTHLDDAGYKQILAERERRQGEEAHPESAAIGLRREPSVLSLKEPLDRSRGSFVFVRCRGQPKAALRRRQVFRRFDRRRVRMTAVVVSFAQALNAQHPRPLSPLPDERNRVAPFFDGWYSNPDGTISLSFGYSNLNKDDGRDPARAGQLHRAEGVRRSAADRIPCRRRLTTRRRWWPCRCSAGGAAARVPLARRCGGAC